MGSKCFNDGRELQGSNIRQKKSATASNFAASLQTGVLLLIG